MRKKKNYRRPDPFAINPEKVLAGQKKRTPTRKKWCEVCGKNPATVHTTKCEPGGVTGWSDLCEPCYESLYKKREQGPCRYCGSPGETTVGYTLPSGESRALFCCKDCALAGEEFLRRPENQMLLLRDLAFRQLLRRTPRLRAMGNNGKLMDEFMNRPENAGLKALYDDCRQKLRQLHELCEKHVRECAAKRGRPPPPS